MSSSPEDAATGQPAEDGSTIEQTHYLATIVYVYEIDADSEEAAEDKARDMFNDDLGTLSPSDFGCVVEVAPL